MNSHAVRATSALRWQCPQCSRRSMSTTLRRSAVGPEHPRYIDIPRPPQQTAGSWKEVKGTLPVPRDVFAGSPKDQSADDAIAQATRLPTVPRNAAPGSREEWKIKMSHVRRQNLREGLKDLRSRQDTRTSRMRDRSIARQAAREEALHRPVAEDERLTAPSTTLDLERLLHERQLPDPNRQQRLVIKARNLENQQAKKREERLDALHELYLSAREFIVTPEQLDKAVDEAFGTAENPISFSGGMGRDASIWAKGAPRTVQDMLNRANRHSSRFAGEKNPGYGSINQQRMRRIAEELTGGKMDDKKPGQAA